MPESTSEEKSKLLYDEHPLVINPGLARQIGLNEAIVLQQIHYWVKLNEKAGRNLKDGFFWTYNTHKDWQEQFPWWSIMTIRRTIKSLENQGLLVTGTFNKLRQDKTKWYRVNEDLLVTMNSPCVQNEQSLSVQNEQMDVFKMNRPLPEINSETSLPEINKHDDIPPDDSEESVFKFFSDNICEISPILSENLKDAYSFYGAAAIRYAVTEAVSNNKKSWAYINRVLVNWGPEGAKKGRSNNGEHPESRDEKNERLRRSIKPGASI